MNTIKLPARLVFIFTICFCLFGCLRGTETGNPMDPSNGSSPGRNDQDLGQFPVDGIAIDSIVNGACDLLADCHKNLDSRVCIVEIFKQENIDTEIGLYEGEYSSLWTARLAEINDKLLPDLDSTQFCVEEIKALDCSHSPVQEAYRADLENPFEGVANMLPLNCQGVFLE